MSVAGRVASRGTVGHLRCRQKEAETVGLGSRHIGRYLSESTVGVRKEAGHGNVACVGGMMLDGSPRHTTWPSAFQTGAGFAIKTTFSASVILEVTSPPLWAVRSLRVQQETLSLQAAGRGFDGK